MSAPPIDASEVFDDASSRGPRPRTSMALLIGELIIVILGDAVALNQIATQSPTDAVIPLLVLSVGLAFPVEALRRLICRRRSADLAAAALLAIEAVLAWVAWSSPWPVRASAWLLIVAAATGVLLCTLLPSAPGPDRSRPADHDAPSSTSMIGLLGAMQAVVVVYVAVLALLDAPTGPFG